MLIPNVSEQFAPTQQQILRHQALRKQVQSFVGQTFFGQLFKQMRNSPFKSELMNGGRGGEMFSSMLDGVLAERMGRGAGSKLVDAIVKRFDPQVAQWLKRKGHQQARAIDVTR